MLRLGEAFSSREALARTKGEKVTALGAVARLAQGRRVAIKLATTAMSSSHLPLEKDNRKGCP